MLTTAFDRIEPARFWRLTMGLVLLATVAAYAPVLHAVFLNLDDYRYLTAVRPFTAAKLVFIFTHYFEGYHPLTLASLGLTLALAGFDPWMHHAVNLALHAINTALVYTLVSRIWGRRGLACLAAAIFGLHPAHVEAVAWVTSRKDVLYACFYLWALVQYTTFARNGGRARYAASLLLFVFSALAKGMAASFPLAAVTVDYALGRSLCSRRVWLEKLPFLLLALVFGCVSIRAQQASGYVPSLGATGTLPDRLALALQALALYTWHLINPAALAAFHPYPSPHSARLLAIAGAALVLAGGGLVVAGWRRARLAVFAVLFFAVSIVMVLQWVPVAAFVVADRYLYMAALAPAVALGGLVTWMGSRSRPAWVAALAATLLLSLGLATYAYAGAWRDSIAVWSHALTRHPRSHFVLNMRGCAFNDEDRFADAVRDFDAAALAKPDYPRTYLNRGFARDKLGDERGAWEDYTQHIALRPHDPLAHNNRGLIMLRRAEAQTALADFDAALQWAPAHPLAHLFFGNRAAAHLALRHWPEAEADATAAIALQPMHYAAHLTRAEARWQSGHYDAAEADIARAEAIDSEDPAAAQLRTRLQETAVR